MCCHKMGCGEAAPPLVYLFLAWTSTAPTQVLSTVSVIRNESMLMELRCADLAERYRTRLLYAQQPEEVAQCSAELADASQVPRWIHACVGSLGLEV